MSNDLFLCIIVISFLDYYQLICYLVLVSCLEHIAYEWKNVKMLLQIETNFITYVACIHADWPAYLAV